MFFFCDVVCFVMLLFVWAVLLLLSACCVFSVVCVCVCVVSDLGGCLPLCVNCLVCLLIAV